MKAILQKIPNDLRDIFTLIIGNGFALFIPVLVSPILSRMYGANDFGVFTIYMAIVSLVSSFATGRYDFAILITRSRYNAQHLFKIALTLATIISLFALVVILFLKNEILSLMNVESMGNLIYLVPLNILLFATIVACHNGLNREKSYRSISTGKMIRSGFVGAIQVFFGAIGFLSGGLILGKIAGDLFSSVYLTTKISRIENYLTSAFSIKRAKYLVEKYDKYLKINAPHALVNTLSLSVTPFILGYYFNENIVGYYGLSYMVCIAPVQLIGNAFYQVFSQKISVMFNDAIDIRNYTKRTIGRLFALAVVPFTILTIFGPEIFQFVFGEKWFTSGEFVQVLAPFLFLVFLISPLTYIPLIFDEHKKSFFFEIALFTSRVIALIAGAKLGDAYLSILLFSAASILIESIKLLWILYLTKKHKP